MMRQASSSATAWAYGSMKWGPAGKAGVMRSCGSHQDPSSGYSEFMRKMPPAGRRLHHQRRAVREVLLGRVLAGAVDGGQAPPLRRACVDDITRSGMWSGMMVPS